MELKEFINLVEEIYLSLPKDIKSSLENIEITVEEKDKGLLLGFYRGVPYKYRGPHYNFVLPDKIVLFKEEIENASILENISVKEKIKKVLLHEIGHYLGLSEEKLRELGVY
ncbi:MAG: metallopeptidase family protein [Caldisericia bacterium]|nr:metallopeptidase family protein [Caldisericia bacterium]